MALRDLVTEIEAKTKWCPLARTISTISDGKSGSTVASNRSATEFPYCIASSCMFWRWSHQDTADQPTGFCGGAGLPKYL